jgi:hypothetical protein
MGTVVVVDWVGAVKRVTVFPGDKWAPPFGLWLQTMFCSVQRPDGCTFTWSPSAFTMPVA